jgi:crossover junction endodeoxyribonuclease RuvC
LGNAAGKHVVLGIDPGTCVTGYGVVTISADGSLVALDYGCIRPPEKLKLSERYCIIFNAIEALVERYAPRVLAVETQFMSKTASAGSIMKLGMARGMALVAAARRQVAVFEYAPSQIKKAVVGRGAASKVQVQAMVQVLLGLAAVPQPDDAADALAAALCHLQSEKFKLIQREI